MLRTMSFVLALLFAFPAFAQSVCDKRAEVTGHLEQKYSEKPVALGMANNGGIVELLTTKEGNTWTIIITLPNGMTCLIAAGEDWEMVPSVQFGFKT